MNDPARGARVELRQWLALAAEAREAGDDELAIHYEIDAAAVEARIAALEKGEVTV